MKLNRWHRLLWRVDLARIERRLWQAIAALLALAAAVVTVTMLEAYR